MKDIKIFFLEAESPTLKEHVDISNDQLIGCFVYFQNVIG